MQKNGFPKRIWNLYISDFSYAIWYMQLDYHRLLMGEHITFKRSIEHTPCVIYGLYRYRMVPVTGWYRDRRIGWASVYISVIPLEL